MELALTFSLVECACGTERQAEQRCDRCGCEPHEVDEDLQRRRQIVSFLELDPPPPNVAPLELETLWSALAEWLGDFMVAFGQANEGRPEDAAARLQEQLERLSLLQARIGGMPKRRPQLRPWRNAERILELFRELVDRYLAALVAEVPAAVEALAQEAQFAIDAAGAIITRFNAVTDETDAIEQSDLSDEFGDVVAGARGAFALSGAQNLLEFEARGAELYEQITGKSECPVGFGIRLQMLDLAVQASFDERQFWDGAAVVYSMLIDAKDAFALLVVDDNWRRDFVRVASESRDAGVEAVAIAAAATNRRRDIRSIVRLGAIIAERLAPPLVATLLTVKRRGVYERERAKDLRPLLQEARDAGFGDRVGGIDLALRDADAHGAFGIVDDGVNFTGTRREYDFLADDELVDRVLWGFESVCALHYGIAAALPEVAVEHEELEELMSVKPDTGDILRIVLAMNGWSDVEIGRNQGTVHVIGTRSTPTPTGIVASLLPALDDDVEQVVLEARDPDAIHTARGPVEPFRRGAATTNPGEKHAASLEALATWTIDGESPIAIESLCKVVAVTTLEALSPEKPHADALVALRALLELMARLIEQGALRLAGSRAGELRQSVHDALRLRRQVATKVVPDVDVGALVDRLSSFAPETVPELRRTW